MSSRLAHVSALLLALALAAALAAPAGARAVLLKRGSRGPAVVQLQRRLHLPADGVFGRLTVRAVRRFQALRRLAVDGVVGPQTAGALGLRPRRGTGGPPATVQVPSVLERIARCESGGNPHAISADGAYRGKYQFDRGTWRAMGGRGDPARAPEAEQDRRALALYRVRGTSPWPACGA